MINKHKVTINNSPIKNKVVHKTVIHSIKVFSLPIIYYIASSISPISSFITPSKA